MAYFLFTKKILENKPIDIFNNGKMERDFTYIDDIIEGVTRVIEKPLNMNDTSSPNNGEIKAPYKIYNIGNSSPVNLMRFIESIEKELGIQAKKNFLPMQKGDVLSTYADVSDLAMDYGYRPSTPVEEGIKKFVEWYKWFYKK